MSFWDEPANGGATAGGSSTDSKSGGAGANPKQALAAIWSSATCGSITNKSKAPVIVDSTMSIVQASALLSEKHVSSAPVYDKINSQYLRLLDFADLNGTILQFIVDGRHSNLLTNHNSALEQLLAKLAVTIIPTNFTGELSKQHPFFTVKQDDPIAVAVKLFTSSQAKVYRAVVLDASGAFNSIISQSDAIRFISTKLTDPTLKAITSKSLSELKLVQSQSEVVTIPGTATVLDALALLAKKHLSSVGVISSAAAASTGSAAAGSGGDAKSGGGGDDQAGKFLGAITHGNVKYILKKKLYASLNASCAQLLADIQKANPDEDPLFASVESSSTLAIVIKRIVGHRFQRVWVIDPTNGSNKPIGVVSLTDILRVLS